MRILIALLMTLTMIAAMLPVAAAQAPTAFDLVIEDAQEDAVNHVVTGVHVQCIPPENPSGQSCVTQLSTGKQDILALSFATTADTLFVKLNTLATYAGTSSLMYVVFFNIDGTSYFTCWNVQSAGLTNNYQDVNENFDLGCSVFSLSGDHTQVGPATRADGVVVGAEEGDIHVLWPVARSEIGDPADGVVLADVYAETYNRGVNTDHAPNTSPQSGYVWNRADRAPDEGVAVYPLGGFGPEGVPIDLAVDDPNATAGPGSWFVFEVGATFGGNLTDNATANASFAAAGPDGWNASVVAGETATYNASANASVAEVHVGVPEDAENGTYNVTVSVLLEGNTTASLNLTITVDTSLEAVDERPMALDDTMDHGMHMGDGNETAGNGTAQDAEDDASIPGPAPMLVAAAMVLGALWARRRRETL